MTTSGEFVFINFGMAAYDYTLQPWIEFGPYTEEDIKKIKLAYRCLKQVSIQMINVYVENLKLSKVRNTHHPVTYCTRN